MSSGTGNAKNDPPRFVEPLDPDNRALTQPGDIIVTSVVRHIRAFVDDAGANTVAAPGQIIRLIEPFIAPDLAVAVLTNPESARSAVGVIPRISLRDVELPLLDPTSAQTLSEAIQALSRERAAADQLSADIETARASLLSLLSAGPTRLFPAHQEDENADA